MPSSGAPCDAVGQICVVTSDLDCGPPTVTIECLLLGEGLTVGSTISPHIRGWEERIRLNGMPTDLPAAIRRVRPAAESVEATQFETITATALMEFAAAGIDVAVVEAGLGGRHDATNVLRSSVVLLLP